MQTEVLPTEDEIYRIYKMTQDYLKRAGYEQYEISNFAQPGFECEHNIGYWTRRNYLGLGLGAASLIENVRYTNTRDIYEYMKNPKEGRVAEAVSRKAQMEEFMFLGLRMNAGVTRERFFREFGISIDGIYKDVLEHMKAEGLLYVGNGQIRLTDRGMDLGNYVMSQFLIDN